MKVFRSRLLLPAAAMLLLGASSTGLAQSTHTGAQAPTQEVAVQVPSPEYGTASQTIQHVSITDFRSNDSTDSLTYTAPMYYYQNAPTSQVVWWAQLKLPTGSTVDKVELDACDRTATGSILFGLSAMPAGTDSGGGNVTPTGDTGTTAIPACGFFAVTPDSPPLVINNQTTNYWLYIGFAGNFAGAVKAAGFRVYYHLRVSPAPLTATFLDVPTSHPYFQFIEALRASGITGGCGTGTNYCPADPVTRGQMAVFLAKALGLHWPY